MMRRLSIFVFSFLISAAFAGMILRFALVDDSLSYTRVMLHEMHHPAENIEMLFVGSSHCYRSIVPELTDSGFDAYTFNAGSSSQPMDGSLALVREAAGKNRLQRVFLEVYYGVAPTAAYRSRSQLTGIWILSDYLRPGLNRVSFLLRASGSKYYMMGFLPVRREWKRLFRPAEIVQTLRNKSTAEYRDYGPPPADRYEDDGTEARVNSGDAGNTCRFTCSRTLTPGMTCGETDFKCGSYDHGIGWDIAKCRIIMFVIDNDWEKWIPGKMQPSRQIRIR